MFERPRSGERAILVHASAGGVPDTNEREEFVELATSAGAVIVDEIVSARRKPDPRYFIGKGKLQDVKDSVEENDAVAAAMAAVSGETPKPTSAKDRLAALRK